MINCYGLTYDVLEGQTGAGVNMILEYCTFGCLQQMQVFTIPFLEASAFIIMRQLVATVAEMHVRNIVHSDLKEGNILISL